MSISKVKIDPLATNVNFDDNYLIVTLSDGREIKIPLEWYPKLRRATKEQLKSWRLIGNGVGIHWEKLDEDLSIEGFLAI
jgi:hypothetical protein